MAAVEESRTKSRIPSALNETYLTLIPKVDKRKDFGDLHPISLCNLLYKVISKVIAERIKPFLALGISVEQFGFLQDRQLLDAVGLSQEGLHSIKQKDLPALVLKLDPVKAYDRLDWTFLRFILLQIGIPLEVVNWIMSCVTTTNFSVLVNGMPSDSFRGERGLRQGCSLSPYLFILVVEGISLLIKDARICGKIKGIKLSSAHSLTHLLFVGDVLLLGMGSWEEWQHYKVITECFCSAAGLEISTGKSNFLQHCIDPDTLERIGEIFPYHVKELDSGNRYLGYFLKPNGLRRDDWGWLIKKLGRRIHGWGFRYLSLGGRRTLVCSVLQCIPVFWFFLYIAPMHVIQTLMKILAGFLWNGAEDKHCWHLTTWESIARPQEYNGWGIKDLSDFNLALVAKSCWRCLRDPGLWGKLMKAKYMSRLPLPLWLRNGNWRKNGSFIWRSFLKDFPIINAGLCWKVGRGTQIYVGIDPIAGFGESFRLSSELIQVLHSHNVYTLQQAGQQQEFGITRWKTTEELTLEPNHAICWNRYVSALKLARVFFTHDEDSLCWGLNEVDGTLSAKQAYAYLMKEDYGEVQNPLYAKLWKLLCLGRDGWLYPCSEIL